MDDAEATDGMDDAEATDGTGGSGGADFFGEDFGSKDFGEPCTLGLFESGPLANPLLHGDIKLLKLEGVGGEKGYLRKFAVSICVDLGGVTLPTLLPLGVGSPDILRADVAELVHPTVVSRGGGTDRGLLPRDDMALACCCCC